METTTIDALLQKGDAPVSFPFRPGKDVLPGKGEWFKRNNIFFRDKVGEFSETYDKCVKVSEKRDIARLVVNAVYENGGRFLDAQGNDIGFRRSMDKAMKALKDRRHVKSRKLTARTNVPKAIRKQQPVAPRPPATSALPKKSPIRPERDPLSTDDAGHALLLLRNAFEESAKKTNLPPPAVAARPLAPPPGGMLGHPPASSQHAAVANREGLAKVPSQTEALMARLARLSGINPAPTPPTMRQVTPDVPAYTPKTVPQKAIMAKIADLKSKIAELKTVTGEDGTLEPVPAPTPPPPPPPSELSVLPEGTPVLWQSVIVSRERPQASLAEMLLDAKQRLDALSSIQKTVSAPICLIYPPIPGTNGLAQGQVQIGQSFFQSHPNLGTH